MEKYYPKKDASNDIVADPGLRKPIDEFHHDIRDDARRAYIQMVRIVLVLFFLLVVLIIEDVYDILKFCSIERGGSSGIGSSRGNS
jgi:hypothetical protein